MTHFLEYKSFTSLVMFISNYFILLVATVNKIVFLICFSTVHFLHVYKNMTDFCILILCSTAFIEFTY